MCFLLSHTISINFSLKNILELMIETVRKNVYSDENLNLFLPLFVLSNQGKLLLWHLEMNSSRKFFCLKISKKKKKKK